LPSLWPWPWASPLSSDVVQRNLLRDWKRESRRLQRLPTWHFPEGESPNHGLDRRGLDRSWSVSVGAPGHARGEFADGVASVDILDSDSKRVGGGPITDNVFSFPVSASAVGMTIIGRDMSGDVVWSQRQ
jgi:hypothetical protein